MSHRNFVARVFGSIVIVALAAWIASGQQPKKVDTSALRNAAKEWRGMADYTATTMPRRISAR